MITLNGQRVPGHEQEVSMEMEIAGEDLSGYGAVTADADTGHKPKHITIKTKVKFSDEYQLSAIMQMAESVDENGERTVYTLVSNLTDAINMRQGIFKGSVRAVPDGTIKRWNVQFTLKEHRSVAEKTQEQNTDTSQVADTQQSSEGQNIAATGASAELQERNFPGYVFEYEDALGTEPGNSETT